MIRIITFAALLLSSLGLACGVTIFIIHHPFVSSADMGKDTVDAKASLRVCRLYASWPVELKPGERLTLERRVCPNGFHGSEDDEGWKPAPAHEVLLLESHSWWHTKIISTLFSDLEFTTVEIGKTQDGHDAVVWSYFIKCGSCHGGPNGVLAWSESHHNYLWNEDWFSGFSKLIEAKLPEANYEDTPASLDWVGSTAWTGPRTELSYDKRVYGPQDANCCPTAGRISANFTVKDGQVAFNGSLTYFPDR